MTNFSTFRFSPTKPSRWKTALFHAARLRRLLNRWVAAVIADHERRAGAAVWPKNVGLYRGPIDVAIERMAQSRLRRPGVANTRTTI